MRTLHSQKIKFFLQNQAETISKLLSRRFPGELSQWGSGSAIPAKHFSLPLGPSGPTKAFPLDPRLSVWAGFVLEQPYVGIPAHSNSVISTYQSESFNISQTSFFTHSVAHWKQSPSCCLFQKGTLSKIQPMFSILQVTGNLQSVSHRQRWKALATTMSN